MTDEESIQESRRRSRTIMTTLQNRTLMEYFEMNQFPSTEIREELSKILNMKPRTVQIWFQNQRQKMKNKTETFCDRKEKQKGKVPFCGDYLRKLYVLASAALDKIREREGEVQHKSPKKPKGLLKKT